MTSIGIRPSLQRYGTIRESIFGRLRSTFTTQQSPRTERGPLHRGPTKQRQQFSCVGSGRVEIRGTRSYSGRTETETKSAEQGQQPAAAAAAVAADMASDQDYMAFLDKANNDADEAHASAAKTQSGSRAQLKALDAGQTAPKSIVDVCKEAVYTSDADEPFEQVSLKYTGANGLPDEGTFYFLLIPTVVAGLYFCRISPLVRIECDGFLPSFLFFDEAARKGSLIGKPPRRRGQK